MRKRISGFLQQKILELGLQVNDTSLLSFFVQYQKQENPKKETQIDKSQNCSIEYYWIEYKDVIKYCPNLKINTIRGIANRFNKLVDAGALEVFAANTKAGCYRISPYLMEDALFNEKGEGIYIPEDDGCIPDEEDILFDKAFKVKSASL